MRGTNEMIMKTQKTDLTRWRLNWLAAVAMLNGHAARCISAIALLFWLAEISSPIAHAQDLDPQLVGYSPTIMNSIEVRDGVAYCAVGDGLAIIDVSDPTGPVHIGGFDTEGGAGRVALSAHYVYLTTPSNAEDVFTSYTLHVIDVTVPTSPRRVGLYEGTYYPKSITIWGRYAYVAKHIEMQGTKGGELEVIDVGNPANPHHVAAFNTGGSARKVVVAGNHAYVSSHTYFSSSSSELNDSAALQIFELGDPVHLQRVSRFDLGESVAGGVAISGNHAYIVANYSYVHVIDISNPANPMAVGSYAPPPRGIEIQDLFVSEPQDEAVQGEYLYLANGDAGFEVLDISHPFAPRRAGAYNAAGGVVP
jgi:hypothetical protein